MRSPTRSRDVSDPVTDPGVRVRVPEVGSLTSRLLSATLRASAETAAAMRAEWRDCLSANARSVTRYADEMGSWNQRTLCDARSGDSPAEGGDGPPGAITPSATPSWLCQALR